MANKYEQGLDKNAANYVPLSPLTFLRRSAAVYPDHQAIVHGNISYTYGETYDRARKLASKLASEGIRKNDTVAVLATNVPQFTTHTSASQWRVACSIPSTLA